jgi:hypothetical protein
MSTVLLGVPGVYDVAAHIDAIHSAAPRFTADGQRVAYMLDGRPVFVAPVPTYDTDGLPHSVLMPEHPYWLVPGRDYAVSRAAYTPSDLAEDGEDELSQDEAEEDD